MGLETERKFLVTSTDYRAMSTAQRHMVQFYLNADPDRTVRVRIADGQGYITVKGRTQGCTRHEWEYAINAEEAAQMQPLAVGRVIDKVRYIVPYEGFTWEVDEFGGALQGHVVAEVELPAEDTPFVQPPFVGTEVTHDPRYYNSQLALGKE